MGAGLHVNALWLEGESELGASAVVFSVVIPVAVFVTVLYGLYSLLFREADAFHLGLLAGTAAVLLLVVVLVSSGASVAVCLLVLVLAPAVTVVGYETVGHRHMARALERL